MQKIQIIILISLVGANDFRWQSEANIFPSTRWDRNVTQLCAGQTLKFSSDLLTTVMVPNSFSFGSILLPNNGELILENNIQIGPDPGISGCSDSQTLTYSSNPDNWYDIGNWDIGQRDTLALDEEQAPCQSDSTDFPSRSTFMVKSDIQIPATLDYMNVWGDSINGDSAFSQYVQSSKSGKYQFSDLHTQWTKENCDSTGCACRPKAIQKYALENICKQKICQTDFQCKDPYTPNGQCCPVCGASLIIYFNSELNFDALALFVATEVRNDYDSTIISYSISKQYQNTIQRVYNSDTLIQILLVDSDGSGKAAKNEAHVLEKKLKSYSGIQEIEMETSGNTGNISGGGIFGILFAITVALALVALAYRKRNSVIISPRSPFENVNFSKNDERDAQTSSGGVALSSMTEMETVPVQSKKRAAPPQRTRTTSNVDAVFSEVKTGLINLNYDSSSTHDSDVMEEPVIGNTSLEETPPTAAHTTVDTIIEVPPIEVAMDFQKSLTLDDIDFSTVGNDTDA